MDKVLIYCPLMPRSPGIHQRTLDSIFALEWDGQADIVFGKCDQDYIQFDRDERNKDIVGKYNNAREMAIRGNYDAMMTIEADMIPPPNALKRLSKVDADIAYGLYVSRHGKHGWLVYKNITERVRGSESMGESPDERRSMWGQVIESNGAGLGCTLISREVLEAIPFRETGQWVSNDWYFSVDAIDKGFTQKHDCSVVCGHIDGYRTLWPDVAQGYIVTNEGRLDIREMMDMANGKYIAMATLDMGGYFAYRGDEVELDEEVAKVLLKKRFIKPAPKKQENIYKYEVKDVTDN